MRALESPATFVVEAPAKINLTLEILGSRADGYHELRSVMVPVSLYDTVKVSLRLDGGLECQTFGDGVDVASLRELPLERHLAWRAAAALRAASGVGLGADIEVTKRIPIGAGMGGGSADAAGTLVALNRLWGLDWPPERVAEVGAGVGCDVPGLVMGGAVKVRGIGELVERVFGDGEKAPAPFWLVVVFPGWPVSTARVFSHCETCLTASGDNYSMMASFVREGNPCGAGRCAFNGLEKIVFQLYPEAERFCTALRDAGALSGNVSGSGSAVFGLADNREHAERIRGRLGTGVWSRVLQTLPDGVMAAHGPLVP